VYQKLNDYKVNVSALGMYIFVYFFRLRNNYIIADSITHD